MAQPSKPSARAVKAALRQKIDPEKAAFYPKFFRTGKGEYGEGDRFLGVVVPDQRKIARQFRDLPRSEIEKLLLDRFHECRMTAFLILVGQYERAATDSERQAIFDYYLQHVDRANNWDLVDASAHKIVGQHMVNGHSREILFELADSGHLWRQRVAMIATLPLIKKGEFDATLALAERFLSHPHDLMHKATGWMLREVGKQSEPQLKRFLNQHFRSMPRTMLRYAIEKLDDRSRAKYMRSGK